VLYDRSIMLEALKTTAFHPRTAPLIKGNHWRRWSGYKVASAYDWLHDREYAAIRSAAALLDISPLHKYEISGKDAARLLDRIITRNVMKQQIGQVFYTTWCDEHGKVIDDGTVTRLAEHKFRLTAAEPSYRFLLQNMVGLKVDITDVSDHLGALAIQGPLSRAILNQVAEDSLDSLKFFRSMPNRIAGVAIEISRTGYTGDLGYELWVPVDGALPVWDALMQVAPNYGMVPAGIWALDVARIEAGLMMADVDYHSAHRALVASQYSSPYELSLDWSVNLEKEAFNGKRALKVEHARGPAWRFVGIEVDWYSFERLFTSVGLSAALPMIAWRCSTPLYRHGEHVGYASSGVWSPLLKKYLALAHVRSPHNKVDTALEMEVTVEHQRQRATAWVRQLPFFDPPHKKS
jgi:aminomethyltransferase